MAFNPFNAFRKHKKVVFAGLTILCMFSFVLSSGVQGVGRDFFTELPRWFGLGRGSNKVVKLNGSWVRERDLVELRARRSLALSALTGANRYAAQMMMMEDMRKGGQQMSMRAQQLSQLSFPYMLAQASVTKPEDLLEFLMWKSQADRLGITLNEQAVDSLFSRLTDNQLTLAEILTDIQRNSRERSVSLTDLRAAVTDEFRVHLAREAILGKEFDFNAMGMTADGLVQTPTEVTPYDFWKFFKENLTTLDVEVLPVPVNAFHTDKQPSEYDIKVLYNEYKDEEPAPDRAAPGFKVPRQIQLEWVVVQPESDYFLKAAREQLLPTLEAIHFTAIPLGHVLSGAGMAAGPAVVLIQLAEHTAPNLPLLREYESYVARQKLWARDVEFSYRDTTLDQPELQLAVYLQMLASQVTGSSVFDAPILSRALTTVVSGRSVPPQAIAGALGQILGSAGTDAAVFAVPNTLSAFYADEQVRRRQLALASGLVGGSALGKLPVVALTQPLLTDPLTIEQMKDHLAQRLIRQLARDLATGELTNLKKELANRQKSKPKDVLKWLTDELPRYHFTVFQTKQLHTQFNLESDPAIKSLKDAWLRNQPTTTRDEAEFAQTFFPKQQQQQRQDASTPFTPQTLPQDWDPKWREAEELVMYWVTEEKAAYVPPLDDDTRKQVVEAWKLLQERQLAKQEADRIAGEVRNRKIAGDENRFLTELGAKQHWAPFSLDRVSKLEQPRTSTMSFQSEYMPYVVPKDRIRYPLPKFVDDLLEKLKRPGEVTVLNDQPERNYYVLVLRDRREPAMEEFARNYRQASGQTSLWSRWVTDQRRDYREQVLRELRIESGIWDENGKPKYELSDEFKRSLAGRTTEEE